MTGPENNKKAGERGLRPPLSLQKRSFTTAPVRNSAELTRQDERPAGAARAYNNKDSDPSAPQLTNSSENIATGIKAKGSNKQKQPLSERALRKRRQSAREAVEFAHRSDLPMTVMVTITWGACIYGDRAEGHILALPDQERVQRLIRALRVSLRSLGHSLALIWARDVGLRMGVHCHCLMFWPVHRLRELVSLLEKLTGDSAAAVNVPYEGDYFSRSNSGGWQVDMVRTSADGAFGAAEYIATQPLQHPTPVKLDGRVFGISAEIGSSARARIGLR